MLKEFSVTLDISKHTHNPVYTFSTSDWQSLKFLVLVQKDGVSVDLTGITPRIAIKKIDKTTILQDGIVTDATNGKCEFLLTPQAYVVSGAYKAEVMLYEGMEQVAITSGFTYMVSIGVMNIELESKDDWPTLSKAIEAGENEPTRITAEETRIANENERITSEEIRQTALTNMGSATENATTQALYAQAQGDYAKTEADRVAGMDVSVLTSQLADITPYLFPKNSVGNTNGTLQNWQWDTTQRINMVAIGDSITEGAWGDLSTLNWPTTGWVGKLRAALQRIYGDGGRGFIGLWRPEWTKVGTWTNNPDFAPWGSCYYATSNTATYTLNNVYGDNAEIYYVNNSAVTFSVSVDGGTAQTITSSSPYTNQSIKVAISLGTLGNHSIQIIGPTSGTLFLQGASVYNGTSGIVLHNLGRSSTRAYEAQLRFDDRFSMMKTHFPAKLTFLNLLANDFTQQNISSSYLDAYKTNMNTIASKIKGIGSDLIVWQPPDNTAAPTATTWSVEQYENESKNVAIANNGAWVNVHTAWGKWSDNVPRMYDTQHPNAQGMKDIAALMFKVLRITS